MNFNEVTIKMCSISNMWGFKNNNFLFPNEIHNLKLVNAKMSLFHLLRDLRKNKIQNLLLKYRFKTEYKKYHYLYCKKYKILQYIFRNSKIQLKLQHENLNKHSWKMLLIFALKMSASFVIDLYFFVMMADLLLGYDEFLFFVMF